MSILAIVAIGACTYWNALGGPFVWDDQTAIVTNPTIQHLGADALQPPRETPVAGRPIVNLTFAINYAIGGLREPGYHVGNIVVHIACTLLLFGIVRRTLLGPRLRERFAASANGTAVVASLIWMVHPIQSEVVDYVSQRTESVMAFFFLLTLYCAIRAREQRPGYRWQALSIIACALGMASKESMVTVPLIVVAYDRIFEFDSWRQAIAARKHLYLGLAATWVVLAALIWQRPRSTAGLSTPVGSWTYLLNQIPTLARYLWLTVWPRALVLDYGLPRQLSIRDVLPAALVLLPLVMASAVALVRWPRVGFLAAAFFLILAPTSSLIPISSEVGAERRLYLPFAAVAVLAALGVRWCVDRYHADSPKSRRAQMLAAALTAAVLIVLAIRTISRNAEYATPLTLWQTVIDRRPQGRARMALATELVTAGQHDEALRQLREAVRDYPDARFALGTELIVDGKIDEGIAHLRAFIADKPTNPNRIPARTLMGQALASQGKLTEATEELRSLLKLFPSSDGVRSNLADVLFAQGRYEEAAAEYRSLVEARRADAGVETKLALSLMGLAQPTQAIEHFHRALQLAPESAAVNRALAEAYLRQNDAAQGERYAREAVRLAPNDPAAHNMLGIATSATGRLDEGIAHFRAALQLSPNDAQIQANLDRALRVAGAAVRSPKP